MWYKKSDETSNDLGLKVIAKKSGFPYVLVHGFWDLCLEAASKNANRGTINIDVDEWEVLTGLEPNEVKELFQLFEARGLISNGQISNWENYQSDVKIAKTPAERVALHRERKRSGTDATCNDAVTGCNEKTLHVTQDKDIDKELDKDLDSAVVDGSHAPEILKPAVSSKKPMPIAEKSPVHGPEFTIVHRDGRREGEKDWITSWLQSRYREKHKTVPDTRDWNSLVSLDPTCLNLLRDWSFRPIEQRMAACAYAARSPNTGNQLVYAIKCLNNPRPELEKDFEFFGKAVRDDDLTVEL